MDVSTGKPDGALKLEPQNLTGSHGEARQEQWVFYVGTVGAWDSPKLFKNLCA
jgi:hypothetical protein